MVGVKDIFGESGDSEELFEKMEMTTEDIVKAAKKSVGRK